MINALACNTIIKDRRSFDTAPAHFHIFKNIKRDVCKCCVALKQSPHLVNVFLSGLLFVEQFPKFLKHFFHFLFVISQNFTRWATQSKKTIVRLRGIKCFVSGLKILENGFCEYEQKQLEAILQPERKEARLSRQTKSMHHFHTSLQWRPFGMFFPLQSFGNTGMRLRSQSCVKSLFSSRGERQVLMIFTRVTSLI